MGTPFVPLLARKSAGSNPDDAVGGPVPAFLPRRVPEPHGCASPAGAVRGEPVVTLEKDGDRITQIRVECVCGEVIELACSYGDATKK